MNETSEILISSTEQLKMKYCDIWKYICHGLTMEKYNTLKKTEQLMIDEFMKEVGAELPNEKL